MQGAGFRVQGSALSPSGDKVVSHLRGLLVRVREVDARVPVGGHHLIADLVQDAGFRTDSAGSAVIT